MAKTRMINTRFWSDNFVSALSPIDRYLFLYFMTNEHTNIAGIYELPIRTICFETALKPPVIKKALERLAEKITYVDGWIYIKNFQKHQTTSSDKVRRGIEIEMSKIPPEIRNRIGYGYPIHTQTHPDSNSDSDSNPNSDPNPAGLSAPSNEILRIQETKNGKPFPNRRRQLGAIGRMLAANYSPEDIERCWEWMGRDSFWGEKGFDFENVANQIGKAKAQVADFKSFAKKK